MGLPIDTSKVTFITSGEVRKVTKFNSEEQRRDASGRPLFSVRVFVATDEDDGQIIEVKVPGGAGLDQVRRNMPVRLAGLTVMPWSMKDGKSGAAFRAEQVVPLTASASSSKAS